MKTVNEPEKGFTCEELLAIYKAAGSAELTALQAAADELYPGRRNGTPPAQLQVETGLHGRWFRREQGKNVTYEAPKYTIKSQPLNWVAVFEDGTAIPY